MENTWSWGSINHPNWVVLVQHVAVLLVEFRLLS